MKSLMIVYNQAHSDIILEILNKCNVRGFTKWVDVQGRGSHKGEPHFGSHAWPAKNMSTLAVVNEEAVAPLVNELKELNQKSEDQGLRVFVWDADILI
jgi:nitrogen regulatory protein PII